jgi:ribonuclease Z
VRLRAIPLGTSAGRPTLQRGASALALAADASWTLCDCGEGAQLAAQRAGLSLSRLDAVLITHLHGDHFNGLPGLLGSLGLDGRDRPLLVAGPKGIAQTLEALGKVGALGLGDMPVMVVELEGAGGAIAWEHGYTEWRLLAAPLDHRAPTFGYRVALPDRPGALDVLKADEAGVPRGPLLSELKAGRSVRLESGRVVSPEGLVGPSQPGACVAYTLDTVPCPGSIALGKEADLLVHEATYEHARAELARARGHSSGLQAAEVAKEAGARKLLLTHFSPSARVEEVADEARAVFGEVVAAADGVPVELSAPR